MREEPILWIRPARAGTGPAYACWDPETGPSGAAETWPCGLTRGTSATDTQGCRQRWAQSIPFQFKYWPDQCGTLVNPFVRA